MRKEIDVNTWDRKEHFEFYSKIATPHYCVAFNIDVTNLLTFTRNNKISFYYSLISCLRGFVWQRCPRVSIS